LNGDVGLALRSDANGCELDVDDVEAVPVQAFVDADGLERCHGDGHGNVIELREDEMLARVDYKSVGSMLTFAFCWLKPMLAALATIAGMAKTAENFMMEVIKKCVW
jgi:hypothetical protein